MCNRPETDDEKMDARAKLEAALKRAGNADRHLCDDSKTIIAAARRHLDTMPKPKVKVKVDVLAIVIVGTSTVLHVRNKDDFPAGVASCERLVRLTGEYEV